MARRSVDMAGAVMAAIGVAALAVTVSAQAPQPAGPPGPAAARSSKPEARKAWVMPKTPWGHPDLQGVWTTDDMLSIPMERPDQFAGRAELTDEEFEARAKRDQAALDRNRKAVGAFRGDVGSRTFRQTSRVIEPADGRIPPTTEEARNRPAVRGGSSFGGGPFNSHQDFSLYDRCITRGIPGSMMPAIYGNAYEIVQGPGWVGIRYEMIHEARIIPLDGRPHVGKGVTLDMGDPRGHWEGDTLVVETTNFTRRSAYRNANPETFKLIERFKPISPELVEWSVTINDPTTWTRPWTFAMNLTKGAAAQQPFEYACHEGNYGMQNMLNAARKAERDAAAAK